MTTLETPSTSHKGMPPSTVSADQWVIDVKDVSRKYCRNLRRSLWYSLCDVFDALTLRTRAAQSLREFEFWAVADVTFQLRPGDALGLLGINGAGKSTLIKLIAGQRRLTSGTITTRGHIMALTELGLGFNQTLSGRENAYINAAVHGYTRKQFDGLIEEIIDFSGIREFIDSAVQTYSSGMKARLGFSVATHLKPDILIVDEVLAVGDLEFRRKCIRHILRYIRDGGSIILVAHDPYLVQSICNRCIVMEKGRVIFEGSGVDGVAFHFQLGHSAQYTSIADAGERLMGNMAAEILAENATEPAPVLRYRAELTDANPIAVDELDVVAADGGPIQSGQPVQVVMRFRSSIACDITWGFSIRTADMQTSIASCSRGLDGDAVHILPGEGTLVALLPDFPLQPGVYAVRGSIGDAESYSALSFKGYRDAPHFFTVVASDSSRAANSKVMHHDLVSFNVEWPD